jgi:hypothetical protein
VSAQSETSPGVDVGGAIALLALPDLDGLTDGQTRGAVCVWGRDEDRLTPETAVDLGEHLSPFDGREMRWFPRSCKACAGTAAFRALHDHAPTCEQCVDEPEKCETGRALWRLIRDGHRYAGLLKRLEGAVLPCEPCATARIFGGDHGCTGTAHMPAGQPCPCCGEGAR